MRTQLDRAQARICELWGQQCAQVSNFDRQLSEAEIERLKTEGSGSRPSTPESPRLVCMEIPPLCMLDLTLYPVAVGGGARLLL